MFNQPGRIGSVMKFNQESCTKKGEGIRRAQVGLCLAGQRLEVSDCGEDLGLLIQIILSFD